MSQANIPLTDSTEPFDVPRHVAIIMDGNGRWAAARGLPRSEGHRRGVEALRKTVRAAGEMGISFLTIFSFSSENWSRPAAEIRDLMGLLRRFIRNDLAGCTEPRRVRVIGGATISIPTSGACWKRLSSLRVTTPAHPRGRIQLRRTAEIAAGIAEESRPAEGRGDHRRTPRSALAPTARTPAF